ncbi:MAG: hypothetical protein AMJ41_04360 [candidate division Zixibacteria bacterium DG_27]|nr:MAG: hypothetical protein AMJ41_04360 [candidate division Zixibacteria bacterium DG_27]
MFYSAKFGRGKQSRKAGLEKLEVDLSASAFLRDGRKGGSGGIPPAEPIARKISSGFFKYTPCFLPPVAEGG